MQNISFFARQRLLIVAGVLLLHALALWGLQSGLLQRAAALVEDIVVPVTVITEAPVVSKPAPQPAPAPLQSRAAPAPAPTPTPMAPAPVAPAPQQAAPMPQATAEATPSANAATGSLQAQAAPAAAAPSPLPAPAIKAELPLVEADYLVKPNREFPRRCLRRREQGTVVVMCSLGSMAMRTRPKSAAAAVSNASTARRWIPRCRPNTSRSCAAGWPCRSGGTLPSNMFFRSKWQ